MGEGRSYFCSPLSKTHFCVCGMHPFVLMAARGSPIIIYPARSPNHLADILNKYGDNHEVIAGYYLSIIQTIQLTGPLKQRAIFLKFLSTFLFYFEIYACNWKLTKADMSAILRPPPQPSRLLAKVNNKYLIS